jgi:amino acid transporter
MSTGTNAAAEASHGVQLPDVGLRSATLSDTSVLAQSVANIAPTGAVAILVAPVAATAGNGGWLTWLISMATIVLVAMCVTALARRITGAGSLYSFVTLAIGNRAGWIAGAGLVLLTLAAVPVLTIAMAMFETALMAGVFNVDISGAGWQYLLYVVTLAVAGVIALSDVRLSTRALLIAELVSVLAVVGLLVAVLVHKGQVVDSSQLKLAGVDGSALFNGCVITFFAFAGFESSSALGLEARKPHRAIPRALIGSVLIGGVFFTFNAYSQQRGLGLNGLTATPSPLNELSSMLGASWLGYLLDLLVCLSAIACIVANLNGVGRILFSSAERGQLPAVVTRLSRHQVPWVPIVAIVGLELVFLTAMSLSKADAGKMLSYCSSTSGLAVLVAYLVTVIGTPIFLRRRGELRAPMLVVAVAAAAIIVVVLVESVRNAEGTPGRYLPWGVLMYFAVAFLVIIVTGGGRSSGAAEVADAVRT